MLCQRTIRKPVHAIGIGVHSGRKVRISMRPAGENAGITFVRTDTEAPASVPALAQFVSDTTLSTTISSGNVQVATVEHLLSALWGLGIDNLVIELSAEEVPIMDGSAAPFIDLINSVGIVNQSAAKQYLRITREIEVKQGDARALLRPYAGFKASYTFVADHPVYNRYPKQATLDFSCTSYCEEVSRARSFGLVKELPQAHAINRCLGSSPHNAIGIEDDQIVNDGGLRYNDEFVKHKLLDAIGDLYLLGRPVLGEFVGFMSGHALNNKLAHALLRCEDAWDVVTFGENERHGVGEPIMQPEASVF
ncbi:MAG: UDP-3-O-acyl-N-acetylglucosamine deacetylase [Pseudomonadales bacterium]